METLYCVALVLDLVLAFIHEAEPQSALASPSAIASALALALAFALALA